MPKNRLFAHIQYPHSIMTSVEVCTPKLASRAVELVNSFIKWHATDIYEWHVTSDRVSRLAVSCLALTDRNMTSEQEDPVVQLITAN